MSSTRSIGRPSLQGENAQLVAGHAGCQPAVISVLGFRKPHAERKAVPGQFGVLVLGLLNLDLYVFEFSL